MKKIYNCSLVVSFALFLFVPFVDCEAMAAAEMELRSISQKYIKLEPGGEPVTIVMTGINLNQIDAIQVLINTRATPDVEVTALPGLPQSRQIRLKASSKARSKCCYVLRLVSETTTFDVPESILRIQLESREKAQYPIQRNNQMAESNRELWFAPQILSCPEQADVDSVIEIRGKFLGKSAMPEKTKVILSYRRGLEDNPIEGDILSVSHDSLRVKVPSGVRKRSPYVLTPGGQSKAPNELNPLYKRHWPADIFTPRGTLGSLTHIYESRFVFAHGEDNSAFIPSNELLSLGMNPFYFSYLPYQKRIDLVVASTILRIRIAGSNRLRPSEVLETNSFRMLLDGKSLKIHLGFESSGTEFIGEYETQDILNQEIYWKHFMNIDVDSLIVDMTLPIENEWPDELVLGSPEVTASFSASFSIFDTPSFSVDETPIRDFIKSELDRNIYNFLDSDDFRSVFNFILTDHVKKTYSGTPVRAVEATEADDNGIIFIGYTTWAVP